MREKKTHLALAATLLIAAGGCVSAGPAPGEGQSITIPYDPYDYDPDELFAEAQAHCEAYGLDAVYVDETVDSDSVRWRYRHFDCV